MTTTVGLRPPSHSMQQAQQSLLDHDSMATYGHAKETIDADAYLNFGLGGDFLDQSDKTDLGLKASSLVDREYISLEEFDLDGDGEVDMDQLEELMEKLNKYKKKERTWKRFLIFGILGLVLFAAALLAIVIIGFQITRETAASRTRALTNRQGKVIATESFYEPLNPDQRNTLQFTDKIIGWFGDQYVNAEISTVIQTTANVYEFRTYRDNYFFRLDTTNPLNVMHMYRRERDGNFSTWSGRLPVSTLATTPAVLAPGDSAATTPSPTINRRRRGLMGATYTSVLNTRRSLAADLGLTEDEVRKRSCMKYIDKYNPFEHSRHRVLDTISGRKLKCPYSISFEMKWYQTPQNKKTVLYFAPARYSSRRSKRRGTPHIYTDADGLCVSMQLASYTVSKCDNFVWCPNDRNLWQKIRVDVGCSWTKLWIDGKESFTMWGGRNTYYRHVRRYRYWRWKHRRRWGSYKSWKRWRANYFWERSILRRFWWPRWGWLSSSSSASWSDSDNSRRRLLGRTGDLENLDDVIQYTHDSRREVPMTEEQIAEASKHVPVVRGESDQNRRRRLHWWWLSSWRVVPRYNGESMKVWSPSYEYDGAPIYMRGIHVVCNTLKDQYKFVSTKKDFFGAHLYCNQKYGTGLASVVTPDENYLAFRVIEGKVSRYSEYVWIGGYRPGSYWVWMDGSQWGRWGFSHWGWYLGWYYYSWRDCISVRMVKGWRGRIYRHWRTDYCYKKRKFLCWNRDRVPGCYTMIKAKVDYSEHFNQWVPDCPKYHEERMTFADAKAFCGLEDRCIGFLLHTKYVQSGKRNKKSKIRFYEFHADCNKLHEVSYSKRNYGYYNRSCDGASASPPSPTPEPTGHPLTSRPTRLPSRDPTTRPTDHPSTQPSSSPSRTPTGSPSDAPTRTPSRTPTRTPTKTPSRAPSSIPSSSPTSVPTAAPTRSPSTSPTRSTQTRQCQDVMNFVFVNKKKNHDAAALYCQNALGGRLARVRSYADAKYLMDLALTLEGETVTSVMNGGKNLAAWTSGKYTDGMGRWQGYYDPFSDRTTYAPIPLNWVGAGDPGTPTFINGAPDYALAGQFPTKPCVRFANPDSHYAFSMLEAAACGTDHFFFCEITAPNPPAILITSPMNYVDATNFCKDRHCGGIACPVIAKDFTLSAVQYQDDPLSSSSIRSFFTGTSYNGADWVCDEWGISSSTQMLTNVPRTETPANINFTTGHNGFISSTDKAVCLLAGNYASNPGPNGYQSGEAYLQQWWKCDKTTPRHFYCDVNGFTQAPTNAPQTAGPTGSPTKRPTSNPTRDPTTRPTKMPSKTPSGAPTRTPTKEPSRTPSKLPTQAPSMTPSSAPTRSPSKSPSKTPSRSPSGAPTTAPSMIPSQTPSKSPSSAPSSIPSFIPSTQPTSIPSSTPSFSPTNAPTSAPSRSPTRTPSRAPSFVPTVQPTAAPSQVPSVAPTFPTNAPTSAPSNVPSMIPSVMPTSAPSMVPTSNPTPAPTAVPTDHPTPPSLAPSLSPTRGPTFSPSVQPTNSPTRTPITASPTLAPSPNPSGLPTDGPSKTPSSNPSKGPTRTPTTTPSTTPTRTPTSTPTKGPSGSPSLTPTKDPSKTPSSSPTKNPTKSPSKAPLTANPSTTPTRDPSGHPSKSPSKTPSTTPTKHPSGSPTRTPTKAPSRIPTIAPTGVPTAAPGSSGPTASPTKQPSQTPVTPIPSKNPSKVPTTTPTKSPTERPTQPPSDRLEVVQIQLPNSAGLVFEYLIPNGFVTTPLSPMGCSYTHPVDQFGTMYTNSFCDPAAPSQCNSVSQPGFTQLMDCDSTELNGVFASPDANGVCSGGTTTTTTQAGSGEVRVLNPSPQEIVRGSGQNWELSPETFAIYGCLFALVLIGTLYQLGRIYLQNAFKTSMLVSITHIYVMVIAVGNMGAMFYFSYKSYLFMHIRVNIAFASLSTWAVTSTCGAIALNWLQLYFWNLKGLSNWKAKTAARPWRSAINWFVMLNCFVPLAIMFGAVLDSKTLDMFQWWAEVLSFGILAMNCLFIAIVFFGLGGVLAYQVHQRYLENRELYGDDYESPLDKLVLRLAIITFTVAALCIVMGVISSIFTVSKTTQLLLLASRSCMVVVSVLTLLLWLYLYVPAVAMTIEVAERKRRNRNQSVNLASEDSEFGSSRGSVTMELDGSSEKGRFGSRHSHDATDVDTFLAARNTAAAKRVDEEKARRKKKKKKRKKKKDKYSSALDDDEVAVAQAAPAQPNEGFDVYDDYQPRKDSTFQNLPSLPAQRFSAENAEADGERF